MNGHSLIIELRCFLFAVAFQFQRFVCSVLVIYWLIINNWPKMHLY